MKFIEKNEQEPESFTVWKTLANDDWQPTFDELSGQEKRDVVNTLLEEQGAICCYCGQEINTETSHIEHFRPQSEFESLQLDYRNLHASCQKKREKRMPEYCGVAKGNWFDEALTISPLSPDCETVFQLADNGQITPVDPDNQATNITLEKLRLDDSSLTDLRKQAIIGFIDDDFLISATLQQLTHLHRKIMERKDDGTFVLFCFAIQQRIQRFLPAA